jgi:hypothetical protein
LGTRPADARRARRHPGHHDGVSLPAFERSTGHLIVKLPASRVSELAAAGQALPFAPNGRTFREWAAFPVADPAEWRSLLAEARGFVGG